MATIPSGTKFLGIDASVPTPELNGARINSKTEHYTIEDLVSEARPYKVYTALLTQTGTTAPVAKVLENTIGDVWFTYDDFGNYLVNSSGLFTINKTFLLLTNPNVGDGVVATANYIDINSMAIVFYDNASPYETLDNALENTPIEIRVYN
jgi:hypothetical protein